MVARNLKKALQVTESILNRNVVSIDGVTIECQVKDFEATVGEWRVVIHKDLTMSIFWNDRVVADHIESNGRLVDGHIEFVDEVEFVLDEEFYELGLYPVLFCTLNDTLYDDRMDFSKDRKELEELYNRIMNHPRRKAV